MRPHLELNKNRPIDLDDWKVCDLCGAINAAANEECHVCRWHGHFDRRAETIEGVLHEMFGLIVYAPTDRERVPERGRRRGIRPWLRRLLSRFTAPFGP